MALLLFILLMAALYLLGMFDFREALGQELELIRFRMKVGDLTVAAAVLRRDAGNDREAAERAVRLEAAVRERLGKGE